MKACRGWLTGAALTLAGSIAAAQQPAPDLQDVSSYAEAIHRVASSLGRTTLSEERRGLICAALIAQGICEADTAVSLLADAESPGGLYVLAGLLAPRDPAKALVRLEQAATLGHAQAQADLGALYLQRGDAGLAEHWLTLGADQENPAAMHILGMAYMVGDVLEENHYEGSYLIEAAAAAGHPQAIFELGRLYLNGIGVGKDAAQAATLLERAGELGMPDGYYLAAAAHLDGPDVYRNYDAGLAMARAAADGGQVYAMILMGDLLSMRGRPFAEASRAKDYYRQAKNSGVPDAARIAEKRLTTLDAPSLADTIRGSGATYILSSTEKGLLIAGGALLLFGLFNDSGGGGVDPYTSHMDTPGMRQMTYWANEGMMAGP